jgi:hypothetical protein
MVLQVLADLRVVEDDVDLAPSEVLGGADAREHEQLGRVVGAAAEEHLAARPEPADLTELLAFDADRSRALEDDPLGAHVGDDREVGALHGRMEVRQGGRAAVPAPLGELVQADAVLLLGVEVVVVGQAGLLARFDVRGGDRVLRAPDGHGQRPARPRGTRSRRARSPLRA